MEKLKSLPKVPITYLIKRIFYLKKNLISELERFHAKFGNVFAIQADNLKCFIKRPDLIKQALVDDHMNYEKGAGFKFFHDIVGFGLLTSDGEKWVKERKVLNFEFLRQNEQNNFLIIKEELEKMCFDWKGQSTINITKELNALTVRTICRILFNYEIKDDISEIRKWFHHYDKYLGIVQKSLIKLPKWIPLPYILDAQKAKINLRKFAHKILTEKLIDNDLNMIKRMKEAGFSDDTICDHIITFFIAGHETTANSLNFTLLLLRDHPKYLLQLKNEIINFKIDWNKDSLANLNLLDLIIKESLRLYPTIPLFPRVAKNDTTLGEFKIHRGDTIAFSPWIMHRAEEFWNEPLKFYPERFVGKKFEREFIYFPFGLGPRACIGAALSTLQMKEILYFILKNFNFEIMGPTLKSYNHNVSLAPSAPVYLKNIT